MQTQIQPYLFFEGRAEEALSFYEKALGAQKAMLMRYKESPEPAKTPDGSSPPGDKVMHMAFMIGQSLIMASDGFCPTSRASPSPTRLPTRPTRGSASRPWPRAARSPSP